jgi:hypothetical protein
MRRREFITRRDEAGRENTTRYERGQASKDGTSDQDKSSDFARPCVRAIMLPATPGERAHAGQR